MCIQPLLISVLIVCSTNGFLELFRIRSWPMATSKSLSLTYGKPDVSCNSLADMYLGKSWPDERVLQFLQFGDGSIRNGYCGHYPYSNIGLTHCL